MPSRNKPRKGKAKSVRRSLSLDEALDYLLQHGPKAGREEE
jgi:hypothetical protein